MGEIAEMMLDGCLCAGCGEYLGRDNGFPEYCSSCARERNFDVGPGKATKPRPTAYRIKLCEKVIAGLSKELGVPIPDDLKHQCLKSMVGLIAGFYSDGTHARHNGIEITIQNNIAAQKRAYQRKIKGKS